MNDGLKVKVLHLLASPLQVWHEDEACVGVCVLKDYAIGLLLVVQDVVDPLEMLGRD